MKSDRKYTLEELSTAISNYNHHAGKWKEANRMVAAKKAEMESFLREEAKAKAEMDREATVVKRIAEDLE